MGGESSYSLRKRGPAEYSCPYPTHTTSHVAPPSDAKVGGTPACPLCPLSECQGTEEKRYGRLLFYLFSPGFVTQTNHAFCSSSSFATVSSGLSIPHTLRSTLYRACGNCKDKRAPCARGLTANTEGHSTKEVFATFKFIPMRLLLPLVLYRSISNVDGRGSCALRGSAAAHAAAVATNFQE